MSGPSRTSALALSLAVLAAVAAPLPAEATGGAPVLSSVWPSPPNLMPGGTLSILGSDLGGPTTPGNGTVQVSVNGVPWAIVGGDDFVVNVTAPQSATSGTLLVQNSFGQATFATPITILPAGSPVITSTVPATPATVTVGATLRVYGTDLGGPTSTATVAGITWPVLGGDNGYLDLQVPTGARYGYLVVTNAVGPSSASSTLVYVQTEITSTDPSPPVVYPGAYLYVYGNHLGGSNAIVHIGSIQVSTDVTFANGPTQLRVVVPSSVPSGALRVLYESSFAYAPQSVTITAVPAPVLDRIEPATVTVTATSMSVVAHGSSFISTSKLYVNGVQMPTTVDSGTQLTGVLSGSILQQAAMLTAHVNSPGGGDSATQQFDVRLRPVPQVAAVTPQSVTAGATVQFVVTGSALEPTSLIQYGGSFLGTSFISPSELRGVTITATPGSFDVRVVTPSPNGGTSAPVTVNVASAPSGTTPALGSLSATSVTITAAPLDLDAIGSSLESGAVVLVDGVPKTTTFVDATRLRFALDTSLSTTAGTRTVTVRNPGGQLSGPLPLELVYPTATLAGFSPSTALSATQTTLTFAGSGFLDATAVVVNGVSVTASVQSPTALQVTLPPTLAPVGLTVTASVANPGRAPATLPFTFVNPAPQVSSPSPAFAIANTPSLDVRVNGSGFRQTSVVRLNGADLATRYVSAGALDVTLSGAPLSVTGTAHLLDVFTPGPGGGFSNPATFEVLATAPAAAPPPITLPPLDTDLVIHTDLRIDLPIGGTVTATVVQSGGGATATFTGGTTVVDGTGAPFDGILDPPVFLGTLRGGEVLNAFRFGTTSGPLRFDRPVRIALPAPSGSDPSFYQPVFLDGDRLSYLPGQVSGTAVVFDTDHLSTFGLVSVLAAPLVSVTPSYVPAAGFHARWAGQSEYPTLRPGQEIDLTVRYANAGDRTWVRGQLGSLQADLGSNAPRDNTRDFDRGILIRPYVNRDRYATANEANVAPGETATFTFRARAPLAAGTYRIDLGIVIDGVAWLEDEGVYLQITVAE